MQNACSLTSSPRKHHSLFIALRRVSFDPTYSSSQTSPRRTHSHSHSHHHPGSAQHASDLLERVDGAPSRTCPPTFVSAKRTPAQRNIPRRAFEATHPPARQAARLEYLSPSSTIAYHGRASRLDPHLPRLRRSRTSTHIITAPNNSDHAASERPVYSHPLCTRAGVVERMLANAPIQPRIHPPSNAARYATDSTSRSTCMLVTQARPRPFQILVSWYAPRFRGSSGKPLN